MSIINGSLLADIVKFHKPEHNANTAAIVIDERDEHLDEAAVNGIIRKQSQQETLHFCKELGCSVIVVHDLWELYPRHIYGVIGQPDFSCIKEASGVLDGATSPPLLPYLKEQEITSLVLMGGKYDMCVQQSLMGTYSFATVSSGILNHQIIVLSSPSLLADYNPEIYSLSPKFSPSVSSFNNENIDCACLNKINWPMFVLSPGMRFYTKIKE
ncbi:hypothetical protein [Candidatus Sororendozoicomonas aggregata]|uniref:hypothetical protein n=1 Tax=Candidatus Sororendozoicomonas aggregata TaxID=3073239 RepID=UPI002ED25627